MNVSGWEDVRGLNVPLWNANARPVDCSSASTIVTYRVVWLIFFCPDSPSLDQASSFGITTWRSCMMIEAVMYGMMPSAKTASRRERPAARTG